jgi:hypothetical protein
MTVYQSRNAERHRRGWQIVTGLIADPKVSIFRVKRRAHAMAHVDTLQDDAP